MIDDLLEFKFLMPSKSGLPYIHPDGSFKQLPAKTFIQVKGLLTHVCSLCLMWMAEVVLVEEILQVENALIIYCLIKPML